ncbi:MAG: hypothetical protein ACO35B_06425 [Luminiphilus sp.]
MSDVLMDSDDIGEFCRRCGHPRFDAVELCEDCVALVDLGQTLRGRYGEAERREAIDSIHAHDWDNADRTKSNRLRSRLVGIAVQYCGE